VYNRSASPGPAEDLNTRARIRDAAVALFGEHGFGVGVRAIAKAAGVSPGLVNHHFGSKAGLQEVCDEHVRGVIRRVKLESLEHPSPGGLLQTMAEIEELAPYMAYLMRSFQAGGALMTTLFENMVADVEGYLEAGVAAGTLRPPRDLKATAYYMAVNNGGGFLFYLQLWAARHDGRIDHRAALREYSDAMLLPALDIYTNALLTDSMMLDTITDSQ
jgi:AcrR family transcriptional regulator